MTNPAVSLPTSAPLPHRTAMLPGEVQLRIRHSLHEEFIVAQLFVRGQCFDFGSRVHHAALLDLARLRLRDRDRGLSSSEEGWTHIEELATRLALEPSHVNVHIYRLRRQLQAIRVPASVELIERRRGCGELRLGVRGIEIGRL